MLRCPPGGNDVSLLSGLKRRRVALCALLLRQPDLLLLDEPTNHLDAESVQWVEQHPDSDPDTIVAVIHDRYFLDSVAQWILELDGGGAYPYQGKYATYPENKAERFTVEGRKDAKRQVLLHQERHRRNDARHRPERPVRGSGGQRTTATSTGPTRATARSMMPTWTAPA
jgi:ATPase subunit of ABC transporter with duplicated ATPase domains